MDTREAPTLSRVIGSRIYLRAPYADDHLRRARNLRGADGRYIHVVPVESPPGEDTRCACCDELAFVSSYLDAHGVVVAANGYIRAGGGKGGDV